MSLYKGPTEGGSGGKRGHSNMEHWTYTEEVKLAARRRRRAESRKLVRQAFLEGPAARTGTKPKMAALKTE